MNEPTMQTLAGRVERGTELVTGLWAFAEE